MKKKSQAETSGATFSPCRMYRYVLWRTWDHDVKSVAFIGLNPSTADETENDPTIRRCIGFAKAWGYGGIVMLNLFARSATEPQDMKAAADPVGPDNDATLQEYHARSAMTVAAWGADGIYHGRGREVELMLPGRLYCLGLTKRFQPKHPLYLRADTKPQRYTGAPDRSQNA